MRRILSLILGCSLALTGLAKEKQQLVVTSCLYNKSSLNGAVLASNKHFKLIEVSNRDLKEVMHTAHTHHECGGVFNATMDYKNGHAQELLTTYTANKPSLSRTDYEISHKEQTRQLIAESSPSNMWKQLEHLTSFQNRYADSQNGVNAIHWVKDQFDQMARDNHRDDTASYFVETKRPAYKQPSLVTVIGKDKPGAAIVVGAHIDTYSGYKQGADDDGTGSATNLELARLLLSTKTNFNRPIYLIWYSAEEWGLIGSQHVVRDFVNKQIPVKAVLQIDMSGYNSENNDVYIVRDYTDSALNDFIAKLVEQYTGVHSRNMYCGYACSDHASWTKAGFPSAMPFEADLGRGSSPYIHSSSDTLETVSLDHMTVYLKLAIGFVAELAEAE